MKYVLTVLLLCASALGQLVASQTFEASSTGAIGTSGTTNAAPFVAGLLNGGAEVVTSGAIGANGDVAPTCYAGSKCVHVYTTGQTGSSTSDAALKVDWNTNAATQCAGPAQDYAGLVGSVCNPALDKYVAIRYYIYVKDPWTALSHSCPSSGSQYKETINRCSLGGSLGAWDMSGIGSNFAGCTGSNTNQQFVIQQDNASGAWTVIVPVSYTGGPGSDNGTTCSNNATYGAVGSWLRVLRVLHRDSTAHLGTVYIAFGGTNTACFEATHANFGTDTSTAQQKFLFGLDYVQNAGSDLNGYLDNIAISQPEATLAAAIADVNDLGGGGPGTVTPTMTAPVGGIQAPGSMTVSATASCPSHTCVSAQFKIYASDGTTFIKNCGTSQAGAGPYSTSCDTNAIDTLDGNYTVGVTVTNDNTPADTGDATKVAVSIHNAIVPRPAVRH